MCDAPAAAQEPAAPFHHLEEAVMGLAEVAATLDVVFDATVNKPGGWVEEMIKKQLPELGEYTIHAVTRQEALALRYAIAETLRRVWELETQIHKGIDAAARAGADAQA